MEVCCQSIAVLCRRTGGEVMSAEALMTAPAEPGFLEPEEEVHHRMICSHESFSSRVRAALPL